MALTRRNLIHSLAFFLVPSSLFQRRRWVRDGKISTLYWLKLGTHQLGMVIGPEGNMYVAQVFSPCQITRHLTRVDAMRWVESKV